MARDGTLSSSSHTLGKKGSTGFGFQLPGRRGWDIQLLVFGPGHVMLEVKVS